MILLHAGLVSLVQKPNAENKIAVLMCLPYGNLQFSCVMYKIIGANWVKSKCNLFFFAFDSYTRFFYKKNFYKKMRLENPKTLTKC